MAIGLSFGTAGIRAKIGNGDDQINVRTVTAVIAALCAHLQARDPRAADAGVCVGYDGRTESDALAATAISVARRFGLRVRAFTQPVPTPLLAFATRLHEAAAGIMITASHNPPDENGIKLYMAGGAQLTAPHDGAIAQRIATFDASRLPPLPQEEPPFSELGADEVTRYLDAIAQSVPRAPAPPLPRFAYSALAGVGGALTHALLARMGAGSNVVEVAEEATPRTDFAGLRAPNPEHASALARLLALTDAHALDLAFAHDPDADRLAVIVRDENGALRALTGDEVGALMGDFLLSECPDPARALLVSTLVSGELLARIAAERGARYERTPTGFKWIAARARALERAEGLQFLFGYEEAIGYALGGMADDKDGIAALYVVLALTQRLAAEGRTLLDQLDSLAMRHGVFATRQITLARSVAQPDLLGRLRAGDPAALLGPGARCVDYSMQPEQVPLLVLRGADGSKLCVRPSGTEPKVKLYLEVHESAAGHASLVAAKQAAAHALDALEQKVRTIVGS